MHRQVMMETMCKCKWLVIYNCRSIENRIVVIGRRSCRYYQWAHKPDIMHHVSMTADEDFTDHLADRARRAVRMEMPLHLIATPIRAT